jgi:hypothetical protein
MPVVPSKNVTSPRQSHTAGPLLRG